MPYSSQNNTASKNDSWDINKTPRYKIERQRSKYEANREYLLKQAKDKYWIIKKEKREYDRNYYQWRKSWGDYSQHRKNGNNESWYCQTNLLNISGDVFTY